MRIIETIDAWRWSEPKNGIVKPLGTITAGEAFKILESHLENVGLMPDEYFSLSVGVEKNEELPSYHTAACYANWGSNEGIYLNISLLTWNDAKGHNEAFRFATGKTLNASGDSFLHMSRIAAECSIMLNGGGMHVKVSENAPSEA